LHPALFGHIELISYIHLMKWKYLLIMCGLVLAFAVMNNLRQPEGRHVPWIGGQDVYAKPAEEAQ